MSPWFSDIWLLRIEWDTLCIYIYVRMYVYMRSNKIRSATTHVRKLHSILCIPRAMLFMYILAQMYWRTYANSLLLYNYFDRIIKSSYIFSGKMKLVVIILNSIDVKLWMPADYSANGHFLFNKPWNWIERTTVWYIFVTKKKEVLLFDIRDILISLYLAYMS